LKITPSSSSVVLAGTSSVLFVVSVIKVDVVVTLALSVVAVLIVVARVVVAWIVVAGVVVVGVVVVWVVVAWVVVAWVVVVGRTITVTVGLLRGSEQVFKTKESIIDVFFVVWCVSLLPPITVTASTVGVGPSSEVEELGICLSSSSSSAGILLLLVLVVHNRGKGGSSC